MKRKRSREIAMELLFSMEISKNSYEETIKKAIALGNDTDTTAAVAGGIAGVLYGFENIPKKWFEKLSERVEIINEDIKQ